MTADCWAKHAVTGLASVEKAHGPRPLAKSSIDLVATQAAVRDGDRWGQSATSLRRHVASQTRRHGADHDIP